MTQAITLRLITRQASGGEIVRTRRLEGAQAMIGRGPDCDIYLQDLSVDPEHAMMRVVGEDRVSIESLTGAPFDLGGKPALRIELDVSRGALVSFGAYDLLLGRDTEGDISVTVMRQEEEHPPGASLFSLRASMFGRRRMAWATGLTILALCLILPIVGAAWFRHTQIHPDQQWSSGPLSKAHAFLEKDCQSCHQAKFVSVRDEACLACHTANQSPADTLKLNAALAQRGSPFIPRLIADHADHKKLLEAMPPPKTITGKIGGAFATAFNHPSDRCASCHLEHTAPKGPIKEADRPLKPTLVVANDCESCHATLKMRVNGTTLVDTPDWSHHPDFRPLVTLSAAGPQPKLERIAVAAHPQENSGLIFSHKQHLDPTGAVARMGVNLGPGAGYGGSLTCASCHRPTAGAAGFQPVQMERDCAACHSLGFAAKGGAIRDLPHADPAKVMAALQAYYGGTGSDASRRPLPGAFRPANTLTAASGSATAAFKAAFSRGGACVDCHTISWDGDGPMGVKVAPTHISARFLPAGAMDHSVPAHRGQGLGSADCADCHAAKTSDKASDVLMPKIAECATCHGKTEKQTPVAAKAECSECHSYHRPGRSTPTGQARTFEAIFAPAQGPARGMPGT